MKRTTHCPSKNLHVQNLEEKIRKRHAWKYVEKREMISIRRYAEKRSRYNHSPVKLSFIFVKDIWIIIILNHLPYVKFHGVDPDQMKEKREYVFKQNHLYIIYVVYENNTHTWVLPPAHSYTYSHRHEHTNIVYSYILRNTYFTWTDAYVGYRILWEMWNIGPMS